jgi:hypothetical protein
MRTGNNKNTGGGGQTEGAQGSPAADLGTAAAAAGLRGRVRDELMTLEYPRHLHKAGGEYLRVENETEARAAVAAGWCVDANEANAPAPVKGT